VVDMVLIRYGWKVWGLKPSARGGGGGGGGVRVGERDFFFGGNLAELCC